MKFETRAIHAGQAADSATGATIVPIYQTTTYTQQAIGRNAGYEYSRGANPTRDALQTCLASLEGGSHCLAYASGMAATMGIMQILQSGDHIVVADDLYGGSYRLFTNLLSKFGLRFDFVDATDPKNVAEAVRPETRMLWIESPTNPMLRLVDIAACGEIARKAGGARLVVDNTFATPYLQNPLELGASIVMHSTTKWIGGHSDVLGGAVIVKDDEELYEQLHFAQNASGGIPGPMDCYLALRGVKTLALRMQQHQANAMKLAEFLSEHPAVERVHYPGLATHPGHELAVKQMRGFGAVLTIDLRGGEAIARKLCESTELFSLVEGLGGVESLIGYPWAMSHGSFPAEEKRAKGITEATVRLSPGIEDGDDLCEDLARALKRAQDAA